MNNLKGDTATIKPERAAELVGVTEQTIRNWARDGMIAGSYQMPGRGCWRISKAGLAKLLKAQGAPVPRGLLR